MCRVLLWEWVMGEEVEWRDLVPMMQALAASTHTHHKTHMVTTLPYLHNRRRVQA